MTTQVLLPTVNLEEVKMYDPAMPSVMQSDDEDDQSVHFVGSCDSTSTVGDDEIIMGTPLRDEQPEPATFDQPRSPSGTPPSAVTSQDILDANMPTDTERTTTTEPVTLSQAKRKLFVDREHQFEATVVALPLFTGRNFDTFQQQFEDRCRQDQLTQYEGAEALKNQFISEAAYIIRNSYKGWTKDQLMAHLKGLFKQASDEMEAESTTTTNAAVQTFIEPVTMDDYNNLSAENLVKFWTRRPFINYRHHGVDPRLSKCINRAGEPLMIDRAECIINHRNWQAERDAHYSQQTEHARAYGNSGQVEMNTPVSTTPATVAASDEVPAGQSRPLDRRQQFSNMLIRVSALERRAAKLLEDAEQRQAEEQRQATADVEEEELHRHQYAEMLTSVQRIATGIDEIRQETLKSVRPYIMLRRSIDALNRRLTQTEARERRRIMQQQHFLAYYTKQARDKIERLHARRPYLTEMRYTSPAPWTTVPCQRGFPRRLQGRGYGEMRLEGDATIGASRPISPQ